MVRYVTLVNLLANEEVFPEYPSMYDRSRQVADNILTWLNDPAARATCVARLRLLKEELARPGACDRAAAFLIDAATGPGTTRIAA
jgi:lipid-A-disaccharide synthase